MVPDGGHGRRTRKVGGNFLQFREADPQEDLFFRCFVRGGSGVVLGDGCVLEIQHVRGGVKRMIRSRKGGHRNRLSINCVELMRMVMTACVLIVIRKDGPAKEGESVLVRVDSSSTVQWVMNCGEGEGRGEIGRDDED